MDRETSLGLVSARGSTCFSTWHAAVVAPDLACVTGIILRHRASIRSRRARGRFGVRAATGWQAYVVIIGGGPPKPKMWAMPCSTVISTVWMTLAGTASVMNVLITAP